VRNALSQSSKFDTADEGRIVGTPDTSSPLEKPQVSNTAKGSTALSASSEMSAMQRPDNHSPVSDGNDHGVGKQKNRRAFLILGIAIFAFILIALIYWFLTRNEISTDDAFTDGNAIIIAPQINGIVKNLFVNDNGHVQQGQTLLEIDQRDYLTNVRQAEAALALSESSLSESKSSLAIARVRYPAQERQALAVFDAANASLNNARRQLDRQLRVDPGATTQQQRDAALQAVKEAKAAQLRAKSDLTIARQSNQYIAQTGAVLSARRSDVKQARARLEMARIQLSRTILRAPQMGWVAKRKTVSHWIQC
jgi:membrane fusion protein, multidrug efflux system